MAIIIKYLCDRCGQEQESANRQSPLWEIKITCEAVTVFRSQYIPTTRQKAEWCKNCVDVAGVLRPTLLRAEAEHEPAPQTLESLIREIVRSEQEGAA